MEEGEEDKEEAEEEEADGRRRTGLIRAAAVKRWVILLATVARFVISYPDLSVMD